jgi:RNA polymerase sigma factor (sigma-70 family)
MTELDDRFLRLYAEHAVELTRFATGLVGPSDAADVVADALARLVRSKVWASADNHRALMYRAVLYESRSFRRSSLRRRARDAVLLNASSYEMAEVHPEVITAVLQLSPQQRAVVVLTYWNDLDPAAIAQMLDVSEGTVRKQLTRARTRLREALG